MYFDKLLNNPAVSTDRIRFLVDVALKCKNVNADNIMDIINMVMFAERPMALKMCDYHINNSNNDRLKDFGRHIRDSIEFGPTYSTIE